MTCYAILEESVLKVGNTLLERQYDLSEGEPRHKALINKQTGYRWEGSQPVVMQVCGFSGKGLTPRLSTLISDSNGCSLPHLEAMLEYDNGLLEVRLVLTVYEDSPFISSQIFIRKKEGVESYSFDPTQADVVEVVGLYEPHMRLDRVTFVDKSDYNDTLVTRDHEILYARMHTDREGQMFLLSPVLHEEKLLLVKEAPCKAGCFNRIRPEFGCAPKKQAALYGSGVTAHDLSSAYFVPCYGATVGVGFNTDLFRAYRAHYGKVYAGDIRRNLFTMSNTWGDRSADKALCEAFMIKEGQCALEMGVELIQLDDGWQTGLSSGSAFKKGVKVWNSGFYREYEDFWKIHEKKFPNGFDPFRSDAYDLGIWFSLDGDNDYAQWEIDAEKMLELHKQYNVTHFKIDGITLLNKRAEWRFLQFFQRLIKESHGKVSFNMDITNGVRLGYLYEKQLGTLFVENRYTDTGAYYPHATLRNLWMLSTYIPTRKMQFEVLNPRRNRKLYGNDPIAPVKYDADYLFASVMVSNPLIWMEMQHLNRKDKEAIGNIVQIWKKERKAIFQGEVIPIGEEPSGVSKTGFQVKTGENSGYFLVFREYCPQSSFSIPVEADQGEYELVLLSTNAGAARGKLQNGQLKVHISKKLGYIFFKYDKKQ